jgi:hypothetical protein
MTRMEATDLARQFVREQVKTGQQWDTLTLASYLDVHQVLRRRLLGRMTNESYHQRVAL